MIHQISIHVMHGLCLKFITLSCQLTCCQPSFPASVPIPPEKQKHHGICGYVAPILDQKGVRTRGVSYQKLWVSYFRINSWRGCENSETAWSGLVWSAIGRVPKGSIASFGRYNMNWHLNALMTPYFSILFGERWQISIYELCFLFRGSRVFLGDRNITRDLRRWMLVEGILFAMPFFLGNIGDLWCILSETNIAYIAGWKISWKTNLLILPRQENLVGIILHVRSRD